MGVLILIGAVVAVLGAMWLTIALTSPATKPVAPPSIRTGIEMANPAIAEPPTPEPTSQVEVKAPAAEQKQSIEVEPIIEEMLEPEPVSIAPRQTDISSPFSQLQLKTVEIVSAQIERLQADYIRVGQEREQLAQELLTSWLIEKFDDSSSRLKVETKKEAQDLRQQLVKVSAEFERVEFRLASLQSLQSRLDDPHVARQIDDLVYAVKQLARER